MVLNDTFLAPFTEWVEALFFAEHDGAGRHLDDLLTLPPEDLFVGAAAVVAGLIEMFTPATAAEVADALVSHLVVGGPDPGRALAIRAVVTGAAPPAPVALAGIALECASFLAQAVASRDGVVPSVVLAEL